MIERNKGGCWTASLVHKHKSTDIGRTLVSPPTGLLFLDVPDEVLEELVRFGVGRRTESVS